MINSERNNEINIPIRAVMNNHTFSAFAGFNFEDLKLSFELEKTKIYASNKHRNCFDLNQDNLRSTFCDFGMESTSNFLAEWQYDYNLFKNQCHQKNEVVNINFISEVQDKVEKIKVSCLFKNLLQINN